MRQPRFLSCKFPKHLEFCAYLGSWLILYTVREKTAFICVALISLRNLGLSLTRQCRKQLMCELLLRCYLYICISKCVQSMCSIKSGEPRKRRKRKWEERGRLHCIILWVSGLRRLAAWGERRHSTRYDGIQLFHYLIKSITKQKTWQLWFHCFFNLAIK